MRGNGGEMGIDEITLQSRLNMSKVAAALLNLEFNGIVKALPGKSINLLDKQTQRHYSSSPKSEGQLLFHHKRLRLHLDT